MAIKSLETDVLGLMTPGDVLLIEYHSREPGESLAWGEPLPGINADVVKRSHLAILEELSTAIVEISAGEINVHKGGEGID